MSTYIIGDVQGCYEPLLQLLERIHFNSIEDRLGFVGDLVNRGPHSLEVLRFIKNLHQPMIVLGNHDLFLLILGYGLIPEDRYPHTLHEILHAPDKDELLDWLRFQALLHYDPMEQYVLVHAGIPPQWSVQQSVEHAAEVEEVLKGSKYSVFLKNLFGNTPHSWNNNLRGMDRLRYITNAFTRMRLTNRNGELYLDHTVSVKTPADFLPWFECREKDTMDIIFGHWAALNGKCDIPHYHALDTGCAWGNSLTALRIEDKQRFQILCKPAF